MNAIGAPVERVDAPFKVTGTARYAAEFEQPGMLHAGMIRSPIAKGRVLGLDVPQRLPGVVAVIGPNGAESLHIEKAAQQTVKFPLLQDDTIRYAGQTIGLVVADTLENVQGALARITPRVTAAPGATLDMEASLAAAVRPKNFRNGQIPADSRRGDPDGAFASAPVKIDATYRTPQEFHNPMEPHATVASWDGDALTVWTATQGISGVRETLATFFSMPADKVRVICPYVGGGFGCKGNCWPPVAMAALAARQVGRPVRLELTREDMYTSNGYRPATHQRLRLAAATDGTLLSVRHDAITQTCEESVGEFAEPAALAARMLYACDNVATSHRLVDTNYGLPTYMRAPGETPGVYALESAMDELAVALRMDPIALRLKNDTSRDANEDKPFSSRHVRECYARGAALFGWDRRSAEPRSMRDGDVLIGWGMATATYPANRQPASARVRALVDGTFLVQAGTQDLGTGTYTIMIQTAAASLGVPVDRVRAELGDTDYPEAPVSGGSTTAASVMPAVQMAAESLRARLFGLALSNGGDGFRGLSPSALSIDGANVGGPRGTVSIGALVQSTGKEFLEAEAHAKPGPDFKRFSRHSFGAQFAEVRVDPDFGTVRVSRIVGVYDAGRILNARTARSQLLGGITFGIGQALLEAAVPDLATGHYVNGNISDYLVPVNADVPELTVETLHFADDVVDPLGARGIGELPIVGIAAAIANAVHHATGTRVRHLPIRVEDVLA